MKLPSTREEYLVWKLEYSCKGSFGVYDYLLVEKGRNLPNHEIKLVINKIHEWVENTIDRFPEFVNVKIHEIENVGNRQTMWVVTVLNIRCSAVLHDNTKSLSRKLNNLYQERATHGTT